MLLLLAAVLGLGDSPFAFAPPAAYPVGTRATGLTAADVDGDGDLDLAVAARGPAGGAGSLTLLRNDGAGGFGLAEELSSGGELRYVVSADFDGDGLPDLATCDHGDNAIDVYHNARGVEFTLTESIPAPLAWWVATGDMNGDRAPDLVIAYGAGTAGAVVIALNDGAGAFVLHDPIVVGTNPRGGVIADLDGNGTLDLALAVRGSDVVRLLSGNGDGSLTSALIWPFAAGSRPRYTASADFDGDGMLDVAVITQDIYELHVFRQTAPWNFEPVAGGVYDTAPHPHSIAAADLDGDGDVDLAVSHVAGFDNSPVLLFANDGAGAFASSSIVSPGDPAHIIVADLDDDGRPDLATADVSAATATVHLNRTRFCPADIDADMSIGTVDLLVLLELWDQADTVADLDGDGVVGTGDLLILLSAWGPCVP